jgi:isopentenyldiphosphate isomerase
MSTTLGEQFSVVSSNDQVLYPLYGKERIHNHNYLHRGVHVFIETFRRGFVLQLKAKGSENAGKWSSAVSGHVRHLESYEDAAIREAKEELEIKISKDELKRVLKASPSTRTSNEFVTLYTYLMDKHTEQIKPNTEEVSSVITVPLVEVIKDVEKNPDEYSPAFVELFDRWLTLEKLGGKKSK